MTLPVTVAAIVIVTVHLFASLCNRGHGTMVDSVGPQPNVFFLSLQNNHNHNHGHSQAVCPSVRPSVFISKHIFSTSVTQPISALFANIGTLV